MKRISAITKRLYEYVSPDTDTDEKLEEGIINRWLDRSEEDVAWLLKRLDDLIMAGRMIASDLDARIDQERFSGTGKLPVFNGLADLRSAIHKAVDAEDGDGHELDEWRGI